MKMILTAAILILSVITLNAQNSNPHIPSYEKVKQLDAPNYTQTYNNGMLQETGYIIDNKLEGEWNKYDEAGNLTAKATYLNGQKNGTWQFFNYQEDFLVEINYSNGKRIGVNKIDGLTAISQAD